MRSSSNFRIIVPAVAFMGLVIVAAKSQSAESVATATPATWHVLHDGEQAKLAYGAANSDQIALMVACDENSDRVSVYGDMRPIGMRRPAIDGPRAPDPLSGGEAWEAEVALGDAGLDNLVSQGRMALTTGDETFRITASPEERRAIDGFMTYCGTSRA